MIVYRIAQLRRGLKADLPTLADGEPGFCEDTQELFLGTPSSGNKKVNEAYTPALSGNWAGPLPTTQTEALDRIAAAVAGLLGGPIP